MLEISPVLSEKFSQPNYAPAKVNFTTGRGAQDAVVDSATEADTRRYTKFDHSASEAGTATDFTFSDFLDLINPIEHIPGVSSIFRSLSGDKIHPISRVAGDILYGGVFGLGSAVFGAAGAVADCVSEASTGHDATGMVVATLLGEDLPSSQSEQVAKTSISQADASVVNPSSSASAQALAAMLQPSSRVATTVDSQASSQGNSRSFELVSNSQGRAYPLDRSKLPYGGVMAPAGGTQQAQALALSAAASQSLRMGSTIYASRGGNNGREPISSDQASTASQAVASSSSQSTISPAQHNAIPQTLVDDLLAIKAARQYQNVASGSRSNLAN